MKGQKYLYETSLPHCLVTALEWSGMIRQRTWLDMEGEDWEKCEKLFDFFAAILLGSYGIPDAYSTEEIFRAVEKPLQKAKKKWMREKKREEMKDLIF